MEQPIEPARLASIQSMLVRVSRAIDAALRDEATALDLTPAQAETLRFAGTIRPDVATVGQLARVLGVRHTTALGILKPLTDRNLIERQPHPFSARQRVLSLTPEGRALLQRLDAVESEVGRVLAVLAPEEAAALEHGLAGTARGLASHHLLVVPAPCRGCVYFNENEASGSATPHYCRLIRRYLADDATRMPCPEHQSGDAGSRAVGQT